jgi:hypothetical protein
MSELPFLLKFTPRRPAGYGILRVAIAIWSLSGGVLAWRLVRFRQRLIRTWNLAWALATVASSVVWIEVRPDTVEAPIAPVGFLVAVALVSTAIAIVEARRPNNG